MRIGPRSSEVGLADILSRHVNFFQRKNSLRGRKIFSRRHVGRTMQILPTIVEKAYQLARAWKRRKVVAKAYRLASAQKRKRIALKVYQFARALGESGLKIKARAVYY